MLLDTLSNYFSNDILIYSELIVFVTGLILLIYTYFNLLVQSDSKYFYFNSPNGINTLIVEENS